MIGINSPIRIGKATVMPGDVVLGRHRGVIFIPPQLAEQVVILRADPAEQSLRLPTGWLRDNIDKLPVAREQIQEVLNRRKK